jgi:hypothetical protein
MMEKETRIISEKSRLKMQAANSKQTVQLDVSCNESPTKKYQSTASNVSPEMRVAAGMMGGQQTGQFNPTTIRQ